MRLPRWPSLLVAGLLAALITAVWCTVVAPAPETPHYFQFELNTQAEIRTRLYYSRGAGWRESESTSELVQRTGQFIPVRLRLLPGKYRGFRFTPMDRPGTVQFRNPRIVTFDGRTVRRFSSQDFSPNEAVVRFAEVDRAFLVETNVQPQLAHLSIEFEPILRLGFGFWSNVALHAPRALKIFTLAMAGLMLAELGWRARSRLRADAVGFCSRRPRTGIAVCALIAAIVASYPVVFLGKSYVSPTNGAGLIYETTPTIPGFFDLRPDDHQSADIAAMMWQHLPYTVQQHRALAAGELPLWNRYSSSGTALLGQGQSMFGDPLQFMVIAARGAAWAFDLKYILAKALFGCGLGFCVWALTRDFAAAALLTFSSIFIGFFVYRFNHPAIFTVSYSPWILVGWFHLVKASDRRAFCRYLAVLFLANWMVLTSGTVKEAYLLILTLNFTGVLAFLLSSEPRREKFTRALFLIIAGFSFILVSSPLWWTFLHTLAGSKTTYDAPRLVLMEREWFVGLFDDLFYRKFIPHHHVYQPSANFLFWIGCMLALMQPRRLLAARTVVATVVTTLIAIALAFELGAPGSGYASWVLKVPLLRNVHNFNNVFSCVAIVHLAVLAGWGFSIARRPLGQGKSMRCTVILTGVWLLFFIPYFLGEPPGWTEGHVWQGWSALKPYEAVVYSHILLLPLAAWLLVRTASRHLRGLPIGRAELALVVVALVMILGRHAQHAPFVAPNSLISTPGTRANLFHRSPALEFLRDATADEPGRVIGTGNNLFAGFATVHDLEGINGPNALDNRHYRELSEAFGIAEPGLWRYEMLPSDLPAWRPILDFLNVRFIAATPDTVSDSTGHRRVARLDLEIFRSEQAWPRAFFTNRLENYDTVKQFAGLIAGRASTAPFAAVQTGDSGAPSSVQVREFDPSPLTPIVPARDYNLENNRTSFSIEAPAGGIVVLQEPWLAGDFRATLNGQPASYFRVNHAFKGLVIPSAGTYRVTFAYWPEHFTLCLVLAAGGIAIFVLLLIYAGRGSVTGKRTATLINA